MDTLRKKGGGILILLLVVLLAYTTTLLALFPTLPSLPNDPGADFPGHTGGYPPARMDESGYISAINDSLDGKFWVEGAPMHHFNSLVSFIAAPFYSASNRFPLVPYLINVLISVATVAVSFLLARTYFDKRTSLILTGVYAFFTFAWYWSNTFFSEPLASLIITASFYFLISGKKTSKHLDFAICGFLVGTLLFAKTILAPIGGIYVLSLLLSKRSLTKLLKSGAPYSLALGFLPMFILWLIRNQAYYGGLFTFEGSTLIGAFTFFPNLERYKTALTKVLTGRNGLLTLCPLFILAPFGIASMLRKKLIPEVFTIFSILAYTFFMYSGYKDHTGQFGLGPRFYFPIYALLFLPVSFVWKGGKLAKTVFITLATISLLLAGTGWFTGILNDPAKERDLVLKSIKWDLQRIHTGLQTGEVGLFSWPLCTNELKTLSKEEATRLLAQLTSHTIELNPLLQTHSQILLLNSTTGVKIHLDANGDLLSEDSFALRLRKKIVALDNEYGLVGVYQTGETLTYQVRNVDTAHLSRVRVEPLHYTYNEAGRGDHIVSEYPDGRNSNQISIGEDQITIRLTQKDLDKGNKVIYNDWENDLFVILETTGGRSYVGLLPSAKTP